MPVETLDGLCQRARQAIAQGSHDQAKKLYMDALAIKADSPDVHYGLATVCFLQNDLHNAAYHFKEVTRLDPLRAGAHINLGAVYNRLDQVDEAIQALRRGIQLDTHRAEGYYNLGLAYRRKKQVDLSIQAYQEAVRLNPRMADAHLNLGNAFLDKGQFHLAVASYNKSLEIRPNWEKATNGLSQAQAALNANKAAAAAATAASKSATPLPSTLGSGTPIKPPQPVLNPERQIDPEAHHTLLNALHRATIDAETLGRNFMPVLEKEIEPAIKELSRCLLYPNTPLSELEECVQKFTHAIEVIKATHRKLQSSMEDLKINGERLVRS